MPPMQSEFLATPEGLISLCGARNALEGPYNGLDHIFSCPSQLTLSLDLDQPLFWTLDAEPASPGRADILLQASGVPFDIPGQFSSLPSTICHPVPRDKVGDQPTVAGSAISAQPPTPATPRLDSDYTQDGDSPTSLDSLRRILHQHFPNRKPPGPMFKHFIYRRDNMKHCKLCPKKLENREQINQHIMKVHCEHFPFACPQPGW